MTTAGGPAFGPEYYARQADVFGWGPEHAPEPWKAALLQREVRGGRVLDIGAGPATYSRLLVRHDRQVVAVDYSLPLLASGARAAAPLRACASAELLPFPSGCFDTTLLLSILEHVDDERVLREAARVTRERIIIQVPLAEPRVVAELGFLFSHWSDRSHLRVYTERMLRDLAERVGCRWVAMYPAYERSPEELYVRSLRIPDRGRRILQRLLGPLRRRLECPPAEAFVVVEPA